MRTYTPIRIVGLGVHTGVPACLDLALRSEDDARGQTGASEWNGPRFLFPGFPIPLAPRDLGRLPRRSMRSTVLGMGAAEIRTPEHLLAALLFFADLSLEVTCNSPELPGMDGSALPFREALAALAPERAALPAWREYPCELEWEHAWEGGQGWEGGHIRVRPAERFRVSYEWARPPLRQTFVLEDPVTAWREILPARTFAFHKEWNEALGSGNGLMAGAGMDSGLLLAESESQYLEIREGHPEWRGGAYPLLNQTAFRVEHEPAKHKILDLLGDLALLDLRLPKLEIGIRNGGHHVNHLLLEKLSHGRTSG